MADDRRRGFILSALLHLLVFLFAAFGLPSLLNSPPEPMAISVDILPISELSNIKPSEAKPEPKKPEPKPAEKEKAKPQPPVKTSEAVPPPPPEKMSDKKEKVKEKEKKKEEKKPDEKKDEKKTKPKEDDLAAVLKAVRETAQKQKKDAADASDEKSSKAQSDQYNPSLPLSMSEQDAIRSQIAKCWNVPAGAKDAQDLRVVLKIQLNQDGSLVSVALASASKDRYGADSFFRAAADSAMRAVRQCSPLQNLPPEKYQTWRDMQLTFDPKEMLF